MSQPTTTDDLMCLLMECASRQLGCDSTKLNFASWQQQIQSIYEPGTQDAEQQLAKQRGTYSQQLSMPKVDWIMVQNRGPKLTKELREAGQTAG